MRESRPNEPKDAKVFLVRECQKSMNRAAERVGMARITHHDLRPATAGDMLCFWTRHMPT
jgi:hypothetical protein